MDVFISWSGMRSGAAAKALRDWLPMVINALQPWISSEDIEKGTRWSVDIASKLGESRAGIICLTPSNLRKDWILFEAGALSKTIENTHVCPLLIDLEPSQIEGPLAQFQLTKANREDCLKLLKTLNKALGKDALKNEHVELAFSTWWPTLEQRLNELPSDGTSEPSRRTDREILDEVLNLVRTLEKNHEMLVWIGGEQKNCFPRLAYEQSSGWDKWLGVTQPSEAEKMAVEALGLRMSEVSKDVRQKIFMDAYQKLIQFRKCQQRRRNLRRRGTRNRSIRLQSSACSETTFALICEPRSCC